MRADGVVPPTVRPPHEQCNRGNDGWVRSEAALYASIMLTLVALVVALVFLPTPWNWILVVTAAVIDVAETGAFVWWSRRRRRLTRPAVGVEDLVGRQAVAVTALLPDGQVRVHGETWAARSRSPVRRGDVVVVRSVDGLVLEVEPQRC